MSLAVVLRPEASRDAEEARDYLEAQRTGLGQAFLDRLNEALGQIGTMPQLYGVVWQNVRAARLRQFSYVVYYRVHDDRVEVLAVLHGSFAWQPRYFRLARPRLRSRSAESGATANRGRSLVFRGRLSLPRHQLLGWGFRRQAAEKGASMADPQSYPYATHLNVRFAPLEMVDVPALIAACTDRWYNQTLCRVNDSVIRLGVIQGEYHWHKHDDEDEFFYVVEGRFLIDLEDRTVELLPRQGFVVPKGVIHRTRAPERTVILMVEGAGIVPTGDA